MKSVSIALLALALPLASHADRLIFPEGSVKLVNKSGNTLQNVSDALHLNLNSANYTLKESKESLLGRHEYYQQMLNGVAVDGSEVVVSLNNNGEVVKVYNNGVNVSLKSFKAGMPLVSESQALETAWKHLKVNGELLDTPVTKLVYTRDLALVYKISLSTSSPSGHFDVTVDARSGLVLESKDGALPRMKRASAPTRLKGKAIFASLADAQASLEVKNLTQKMKIAGITVKGSAQVFDPNPVVTLGRTDLQDGSPASLFTQAYTNEDLLDITFSGGVYSLKGPKITLIDFESPNVAPSTSADGSWIFERKNVKFNDAMTYLHIDRSIRYIESLGFSKSKVIFPKSIEVDANGVNGDDNSHYIPSSRRLAFGHGCVDDNEDADVILHELGHAIQHHINSSWGGGDTGAMGEGFGDYWASSYSATTPGGLDGNVNWAFKWDGHNECWPGRNLDTYSPAYSSTSRYPAHAQVNGGISDELWSTPIFQAFLELYKSGVPRADIDKIILESHFGLGSGVKMPDMAKSIVKTAKALFPTKNYDQVYTRHFKKVKIL